MTERHKVLNSGLLIYEKLSNSFLSQGNKIEILDSGKIKYEKMFEDIRKAKKSILIEYYIGKGLH